MKEVILEKIRSNDYLGARNMLVEMNHVDITAFLDELKAEDSLKLFRLLPKEIAADVLSNISMETEELIISSIKDNELQTIISEMFIDDTVDIIEEMPAHLVKKILKNTTESKRNIINKFLKYPDDSAGSIMTIEFLDLKKEMTIAQAIERIKKIGINKETVNDCYVTDANRKLEGVISLKSIILADDNELIDNIMEKDIKYIYTQDDQEHISHQFKKYDFLSMPVVDNEKRLVGIITIDDIVDIIEEENTEDIHKMAAITPLENNYMNTGVFTLAKKRVFWLLLLMISATLTQNIIESYTDIIKTITILTAFIPMLMATGGNAGAQASATVIRGLAIGDIKMKNIFIVVWKEIRVAVLAGLVVAVVNFIRIYFWRGLDLDISLIVCATMLFTVIVAKTIGSILPIIAKFFKLDPAIMASPLITTIVDALTVLIYFILASSFL